MHVGKYYLKRKKWVAAINRFKTVISDYETTVYVEEALHRLVEIYFSLGLMDEAIRYASTLGFNFPDSDWYAKSYELVKDLS